MKIKFTLILLLILISITSCRQSDKNRQIDEVEIKNDVYISNELGWHIKIPENWKVVAKEETEEYKAIGKEGFESIIDEEIDTSKLKVLISFKKTEFNLFLSNSEPFKLEYEGEWEENNSMAKKLIYDAYLGQGIGVDSTETKIEKIDGKKFHTYELKIYSEEGDVILNQLIYSRLINGYDLFVSLNYDNESDKKEMLDAWLNSKFSK